MVIGIIGGGASGMTAALAAAENKDVQVVLMERQARVGRKLQATGGLDRDGILGFGGVAVAGLSLGGGSGCRGFSSGLLAGGGILTARQGGEQHQNGEQQCQLLVQIFHFFSPVWDFVRYVYVGYKGA